ncbi:hypothetical protein [Nocardia sp. NRRL S-836]|uniref:hypothetical protein n=1 Tax=Nocardia sp. NRRL S-836 TaxID=1519492 RepID=UPI000A978728|nr:hypothetical protein [Nocardia sp. NRRL S-836]
MSGNDSPSAVNWEAYSHSELHQMLWQDADVGSVSKVADEWTAHRAALATHAEVLREQRAALLGDWQGVAAEEAAARLGALADRIEKIGALAEAGQRAAQDAADALAAARAAMPPPPAVPPVGDGMTAAPGTAGPAGFGAGPAVPGLPRVPDAGPGAPGVPPVPDAVGSAGFAAGPGALGLPRVPDAVGPAGFAAGPGAPGLSRVPDAVGPAGFGGGPAALGLPPAPDAFRPAGFSLPSAPAFSPAPFSLPSAPSFAPQLPQPVSPGSTGISFFFTVGSADQQKAQAVRAMQTYESSLNGSSRLIDDARGAVPQPATTTSVPPPPRASQKAPTGVPWQRLTGGGGGGSAVRAGVVSAPVPAVANGPAPLAPGMRAGVVLGATGGPAGLTGSIGEANARGQAQNGAMAPPPSGARGDDEQEHQNQMPTLDHGLFELDERACPPVIGVEA